jgi:hypothetical protein
MRKAKKLLAHKRETQDHKSVPACFSLYPSHLSSLKRYGDRFNLGGSFLIQMLVEINDRDGLIDKEVNRRVTEAFGRPAQEGANN